MASMFDTIADMLRGSAPDDLAHALGTDRTQTRRAMEIGLPALITGLRDKTLEPGGASAVLELLSGPDAHVPADVGRYLAAGDPAQGAALLDVAFGDRGEPALNSLSEASGLSTRLLAQVMSVLAPLATGVVGNNAERSTDGVRSYLQGAVDDLETKGFGRVVELVSPGIDLSAVPDEGPDYGSASIVGGTAAAVGGTAAVVGGADISTPDFGSPDLGGTVVEGAFPPAGRDEIVALDDLGPPPEPMASIPGAMPELDGDPEVTIAPPSADIDYDEGRPMSAMGWLWWLLGAIAAVLLLLFIITQCTGDDEGDTAATTTTDLQPEVVTATPDPLVAQRQAALNAALADYPGVSGEVFGDVAVLNGTVADDRTKAVVDQAARAVAGMAGVQNNLQVVAPEGPEGYSLNDIVAAQPELTTLKALLDEAGIGDALDGNGPFTIFAPTNDAFAAVSDQLGAIQGDRNALQGVLSYHVVSGALSAADVAALPSLTTLQGEVIEVNADGGTVTLNGATVVRLPDVEGRNGLLHIVSDVLLPPSLAPEPEPPAEIGAELALAPITFAPGSSDLTDAGKVEVDKVVAYLLENPFRVEIGGHTDSDGSDASNQTLSQQRADAVREYMIAQGIEAGRLVATGFGESQPIVDNDTEANKARNRRIEFRPIP